MSTLISFLLGNWQPFAVVGLVTWIALSASAADRLRDKLTAAEATVTTLRAANDASRQSFAELTRINDLGYAAISAAETAARERAAFVAATKETARHAPRPPDACTTVGPYTGAVLDGLRRRAAGADRRNPADPPRPAAAADRVRP